jgi:hypothetical protein
MAASYSTGSSSSPTNLLQTLVTWLVAQGWTQDANSAEGTGWRSHLHKGTQYVNLRAAGNENIWPREAPPTSYYHDYGDGGYGIGLYLGTGYNVLQDWDMQAGGPVRLGDTTEQRRLGCGMNLPASGGDYHFFDDGNDNITVVVERSPGIFTHMGWGPAMADAGQPEDFWYFYGSASAFLNTHDDTPVLGDRYGVNLSALPPMSHVDKDNSSYGGGPQYVHSAAFVRVDSATYSARWIGDGRRNEDGFGYTGRFMRDALNLHPGTQSLLDEDEFPGYQYLHDRIYQAAFAGALLLPLHCYVLTDPDARWAPIGYAPTVFWCEAVGNGYAQNQVYQVGGVNYMLFPHFAVLKGA